MKAAGILFGIPQLATLVVGDVCLDRWCFYDPSAADVSRETGIPRTGVIACEVTPGAAGTVANNLAALGVGTVAVLGVTGDDGHAFELRRALEERKIYGDYLIADPSVQTFTYTKLINTQSGLEDLPRVDFINLRPLPAPLEEQVVEKLREVAPSFDVIIVSDQAETEAGGVVTPAVRAGISQIAADHPGKTVWVDSRRRAEFFRNVIVKPNEEEARQACLRAFGAVDFARLRAYLAAPALVVTRGAGGATVVLPDSIVEVATKAVKNPVDICGAGDSFSAGAACAYQITGSAVQAARFGNLVSSVTIMKKGTGTASPSEVLEAERRLGSQSS